MKNGASSSVFAVMGVTGTGKSMFIKLLTNDENIRIGHAPESETSSILTSSYVDRATGRPVTLIDTPGFDDSREGVTDTDILRSIVDYLEPESGERRKLNGIIYMHRISDPRVGGVSRKNLRMLYSLCGEKNLGNVRIVTTNWGRVSEEEGNRREADLKGGAFKALIDAGVQLRRHVNTAESAREIMSELVPLELVTLKIQEEVREGKKLGETAAGKVLTAEMQEMQKRNEREMANLRKELEEAAKAHDRALRAKLEEERKVLEDKTARIEADRAVLRRTLEEQRVEQERERSNESAHLSLPTKHLTLEHRDIQAQATKDHEVEIEYRMETSRRLQELERQVADANDRMKKQERELADLRREMKDAEEKNRALLTELLRERKILEDKVEHASVDQKRLDATLAVGSVVERSGTSERFVSLHEQSKEVPESSHAALQAQRKNSARLPRLQEKSAQSPGQPYVVSVGNSIHLATGEPIVAQELRKKHSQDVTMLDGSADVELQPTVPPRSKTRATTYPGQELESVEKDEADHSQVLREEMTRVHQEWRQQVESNRVGTRASWDVDRRPLGRMEAYPRSLEADMAEEKRRREWSQRSMYRVADSRHYVSTSSTKSGRSADAYYDGMHAGSR